MIRVQVNDFSVEKELINLTKDNMSIGGVCSFVGFVRGINGGEKILAMQLEHYPGMTEHALTEIETIASSKWSLENSLIIHRYGELLPGEKIVFVATAARHRQDAFDSCNFLIDWLKTKAPFWKLEKTSEGERWVQLNKGDLYAHDRWIEN